MSLLDHKSFYLVGIKGVAMTALAQCLLDAGKSVTGSDVKDDFVTKEILDKFHPKGDQPLVGDIKIDLGFEHDLPENTDILIYTAAHCGPDNLLVKQAENRNIPTLSHAQALSELFNHKKGIAVCGVGGKSTVSAMIAWIMEKTNNSTSYAVGVGNIIGLNKTGQWKETGEYFVAEADEYVVDPAAREKDEEIVARFSYLKPHIIVCTNLKFDHPDVYRDFDHTKEIFKKFFENIKPGGYLIINADDDDLRDMSYELRDDIKIISFGENKKADLQLLNFEFKSGISQAKILFNNLNYDLKLQVPGKFNIMNVLAAILACSVAKINIQDSIDAIQSFRSTQRRFEFVGEKKGVKYYDDYAHHPAEIEAIIQTLNDWYPDRRIVYAFQSHTFSRTKQLFNEFVDSFTNAKEVVMIDIFASAREKSDPTISSDLLCEKIQEKYPHIKSKNLKTIDALAKYCQENLEKNDILITLGAGDIYQVHKKI